MENNHIGCNNKIRSREKLVIQIFALMDVIRNVYIVIMRVLNE